MALVSNFLQHLPTTGWAEKHGDIDNYIVHGLDPRVSVQNVVCPSVVVQVSEALKRTVGDTERCFDNLSES